MFLDPLTWTNLWVLVEIQIFAFMSLHIERLIARDIISVRIWIIDFLIVTKYDPKELNYHNNSS